MNYLEVTPSELSQRDYIMSSFGYSNVVGYASHLPLKHVKLPLKYDNHEKVVDLNEQFRNKSLGFGGFLDLSTQSGLPFESIQYGVSNDMKTVHLSPVLVDEATSLGIQFQNLVFHLPHSIISKGTAGFQFVPLVGDADPYIIIDLIEENFLFITLKIEIGDFFIGNGSYRLVLDKLNTWVNISVPYSFELRSVPFFLKLLDPSNVIVSLKDGGLLHFSRLGPLAALDIFNFTENAALMSFGGLFRTNKSDIAIDGVSSNSVVDIVQLDSTEFVALTVSKTLKFWNMNLHKQTRSFIDLKTDDSKSWLTTIPSKYLQTYQSGSERFLSLFATSEEEDERSSKVSGFRFQTWAIPDKGDLKYLEALSLTPELPMSIVTASEAKTTVFKIQDFQIVSSLGDHTLSYYILWKSNTHSVLCRYRQEETGNISSTTWSHSFQDSLMKDLTPRQGGDYYFNSIFNTGKYDTEIVKTALSIFAAHSGEDLQVADVNSLRKSVTHTINSTSKAAGVSAESLWYKLELICEEFKKLSQEPLGLLVTPSFILTAQVNGISVFRTAHIYESFLQPGNESRLAKLLVLLSTKFSPNTYKRLASEFVQLKSIDANTATDFASRFLSNKISDEDIQSVMEELESIPNVVDEIKMLIGSGIGSDIALADIVQLSSGEGIGLFSKLLTISAFKNIKANHEIILLSLLILFLLCEVNESVLQFIESILQRYSRYGIIEQVFETSFYGTKTDSAVELRNVSKLENSIFWSAVVSKNSDLLSLIKNKDYNVAFDYFCDAIVGTGYDDFMVNIILELVDRNEGKLLLEKFTNKFDLHLPIKRFLTGLIYYINDDASSFFDVFIDYSTFEAVADTSIREKLLRSLTHEPIIKAFLSSIFSSAPSEAIQKANYYHQLSEMSKAQSHTKSGFTDSKNVESKNTAGKDFLSKSLEFEKIAIATLEQLDLSDLKVRDLISQFHRNLFACALESSHYSDATDSLYQLSPLVSKNEFCLLFSRFLRTLRMHHEIPRIFRPTDNHLFSDNFLLVDTILLQMANEDLILSNALKCYEFLYSWRLFGCTSSPTQLGDKRGAVEALYIFITRFKMEKENLGIESNQSEDFKQFKLKILELYMIILNCLKTYENEEEKWIIKRDNSKKLSVIRIEELTLEYYRWLKELEHDLGD